MFVMITVLTVASSAYLAGYKAWQKGSEINEITQNSRIAIDKISRELRQTDEIITSLPANEIEFQDGRTENLQYLRYYLEDHKLHRQIIGADREIQEDEIIAEYISNMQFSGNKLIQIQVNDFITKTAGRNIK
ncbi:MAG: hypothetical protein ABIG90_03310 [bacterium]